MKLSETDFFLQFTAVVAGTFLAVMTFAFVSIPLTLDGPVDGAPWLQAMTGLV